MERLRELRKISTPAGFVDRTFGLIRLIEKGEVLSRSGRVMVEYRVGRPYESKPVYQRIYYKRG